MKHVDLKAGNITRSSVLLVLLVAAMASAQPVPPQRKIIDVHMHAESKDPRFGHALTNPLTGQQFPASADESAHIEESLALMQRLNVVKAVVSGRHHDSVLRWSKRAPDKVLVGFGFDDLAQFNPALLRREHAAGRLHVLGEIAVQYERIRADDPRMEPIYSLAEELDIPVGLHMHPGPPGAPYPPFGMTKMRAGNGNPLVLEDVLVRHPKMRIYIMHAGWPFLTETIALLYSHPQVYVELGVIDWSQPPAEFHRYLRTLVEAGYGKRIMFGSDQMVWPQTLAQAVRNLESATFLTPEQKDDIFYNNAARFLRLDRSATQ
ncbi:MAG: amidohydrolase family protein [Acidobacteriales bacterium]|nr:amidohydrolase family protein [Terriglobales bacterium]